ncbi:scruin like at the midline isoform X3 [Ptiloglossa arizonensis]|uniref:scruin like at the midline isoform X3 n=1 Tax=Ptiloglossa arizonensis TaxID=3350558 RepID=UPI003FA157A6
MFHKEEGIAGLVTFPSHGQKPCHQWQRLPGQDNMPNELASNAVILRGNTLMVYGGTGVPFGESCSNRLYLCNLNNGKMDIVPAKGDLPDPHYGQAIIYHGCYLYTVGGTSGFAYTCDIHRFDLRTGIWEKVYICSGIDQNEPSGRYRHELAFDGRLIYVLGGGTGSESFGFLQIHAFDLEMKKWVMLTTSGDNEDNTVPEPRRCHGCVQYTDQNTGVISVIISGGYNGEQGLLRSKIFSDVWRLDLNNLQWTCLRKCKIPRPLYFHSAALTPEGLMYTFGGTINKNNKVVRTDAVYSVWLRIPKLSEICWQALIHYFPHLCRKSRHQLLLMGVPSKFVQRIDFF